MIAVEKLTARAGTFALRDISFEVPAGKYAVLMGRTGSGKTTLLEAICGLRAVDAGRVLLREVDVTQMKPAQRGIGYVPQDGALFASMTVRENLAFALAIRGDKRPAIDTRIGELAAWLGIAPLLNRRVAEGRGGGGLSGGERQRIALGRALAARPSVLCMDEPLSALDDATREQMYDLLRTVNKHENVTVLHVTHNQNDADRLADQILRFEEGRIVDPQRR